MEKVSVYSTCFNSYETLTRSVEALRRSTYRLWEILTVHDGGDPCVWPLAESLGVVVRRDHDGENRGLAASCNTALRHCTGDFLAKVDSDVELSPHWLAKAMVHFRDDRVAGVGGRMVEAFANTLPMRWRARFMPQHFGGELMHDPVGLFGADCVFRVSALQKVGGWNERYRTNFEDMDVSRRLKEAGFLLVYEPKALARHLRHDSLADVMDNFWRWWKDSAEDQGAFNSVECAAKLVERNAGLVSQQIGAALGEGSFDLVYPSLLLFFRLCMADLRYLVKKGTAPEELAAATAFHVLLEVSKVAARLPDLVGKRLVEDVPITVAEDGWEPDATYLEAFRASLCQLEVGPEARWALETSVMALED